MITLYLIGLNSPINTHRMSGKIWKTSNDMCPQETHFSLKDTHRERKVGKSCCKQMVFQKTNKQPKK